MVQADAATHKREEGRIMHSLKPTLLLFSKTGQECRRHPGVLRSLLSSWLSRLLALTIANVTLRPGLVLRVSLTLHYLMLAVNRALHRPPTALTYFVGWRAKGKHKTKHGGPSLYKCKGYLTHTKTVQCSKHFFSKETFCLLLSSILTELNQAVSMECNLYR